MLKGCSGLQQSLTTLSHTLGAEGGLCVRVDRRRCPTSCSSHHDAWHVRVVDRPAVDAVLPRLLPMRAYLYLPPRLQFHQHMSSAHPTASMRAIAHALLPAPRRLPPLRSGSGCIGRYASAVACSPQCAPPSALFLHPRCAPRCPYRGNLKSAVALCPNTSQRCFDWSRAALVGPCVGRIGLCCCLQGRVAVGVHRSV